MYIRFSMITKQAVIRGVFSFIKELARLVDNNIFESDKHFNTVRIIGRIKYLIIENRGRVDDYHAETDDDEDI